jgi:hypothetical protein
MSFGEQALQSAVLRLKLIAPLGVPRFEPAALRPPSIKAGRTEAMPATQLSYGQPRLGLLDESDDLLGGESTFAQVRPLRMTDYC